MEQIINKGCVVTDTGKYERYAVKTHFVNEGENYFEIFQKYVVPFAKEDDIVLCGEKVVALCQNRIVRKSEMKLSFAAKFLSKFASVSSTGIGVNEPYKMQFAIDTVGLPKVVYASVAAGIGKVFRKKGVFYEIVGIEVSGLDGFYGNVWEKYGEMGILIPEKPKEFCEELYNKFNIKTVIVDANDIGQEVLGKTNKIELTDKQIVEMIRDNPAGQGRECTPFIVVRKM
ncbi:MAG: F420-0--gamma-glutamyl ligase [Clostridia bacterium]|nr:F420-0--gamma-glutamyl ligase [Clostridia bacterium]